MEVHWILLGSQRPQRKTFIVKDFVSSLLIVYSIWQKIRRSGRSEIIGESSHSLLNFCSNVTLPSIHRAIKDLWSHYKEHQQIPLGAHILLCATEVSLLVKRNQPILPSLRKLLIPSGLLLFVTGKFLRLFPDKQEIFEESVLTSPV